MGIPMKLISRIVLPLVIFLADADILAQDLSIFIPGRAFSVVGSISNNAVPVYAQLSGSSSQNVVMRYSGSVGNVTIATPVIIPPSVYGFQIADILFIPREAMSSGDSICYNSVMRSLAHQYVSGYSAATFGSTSLVSVGPPSRSGFIDVDVSPGQLVRGSHTATQDSIILTYSNNSSTSCTPSLAEQCGNAYGIFVLALGACQHICTGSGYPFSCCTGLFTGCNNSSVAPFGPGGFIDFVGIRLRWIQ